jgi:hypothetical protein
LLDRLIETGSRPELSLPPKTVAMKTLTLLLLLMMTPSLGGENVAFSRQAADTGAHKEGRGARPLYEYATKHQINAAEEKRHSNEKRLFSSGLSNDVEVQRLKLMLLLLMSLGPYHTAGQ